MLEDLLAVLHNWFDVDRMRGTYVIAGGTIELDLASGQYFRIVGSIFNDGLHQYPASDLTDEVFTGEIWALAIPKAVQELSEEVDAWVKEHPESDYTSESFGGYSYSKATDSSGAPMGWRAVFRSKINRWKKIA